MVFNVIFPYILIVKIVKHTTHWKKSNPFHTDLNNEDIFLAQIIGYPEIEWNSGFTGLT